MRKARLHTRFDHLDIRQLQDDLLVSANYPHL